MTLIAELREQALMLAAVDPFADDISLCGTTQQDQRAAHYVDLTLAVLQPEIERLTGERDAALREMGDYARQAGEWKGRFETSEQCGIVEGWQKRAQAAEARLADIIEQCAKVADAHVLCGCDGSQGRCNIDDTPKAIAAQIRALAQATTPPERNDG